MKRLFTAGALFALGAAVSCKDQVDLGGTDASHDAGDSGEGGSNGSGADGGAGSTSIGGTRGGDASGGSTSGGDGGAVGGATSGNAGGGAGGTAQSGGAGAGDAGNGSEAGAGTVARLEIYGLAQGEPGFVATGSETMPPAADARGVIYHSEDGIEWERVASDLAVIPWDVEWGNSRFVALGSYFDSTGMQIASAYVSTNGQDWVANSVPASNTGFWMAFGNGVFVGTSSMGSLSSSDGANWALDIQGPWRSGVEFAGGTFVGWGTGDRSVWVGTGAGAWETVALDPESFGFTALNAVNEDFRGMTMHDCCGGEIPGTARWERVTSEDGRVWVAEGEELDSEPPLVYVDDGSVCVALVGKSVHSGPSCDELEVTFDDGVFQPWRAISVDGLYLVGGAFGGILASTDGVNWTRVLWEQ